jgi:F-type H+-transporting ATPase subunit a
LVTLIIDFVQDIKSYLKDCLSSYYSLYIINYVDFGNLEEHKATIKKFIAIIISIVKGVTIGDQSDGMGCFFEDDDPKSIWKRIWIWLVSWTESSELPLEKAPHRINSFEKSFHKNTTYYLPMKHLPSAHGDGTEAELECLKLQADMLTLFNMSEEERHQDTVDFFRATYPQTFPAADYSPTKESTTPVTPGTPNSNWQRDSNMLLPLGGDYTKIVEMELKFSHDQSTPDRIWLLDATPSQTKRVDMYYKKLARDIHYDLKHAKIHFKLTPKTMKHSYDFSGRSLLEDTLNRPIAPKKEAQRFHGYEGIEAVTQRGNVKTHTVQTRRATLIFPAWATDSQFADFIEDARHAWQYVPIEKQQKQGWNFFSDVKNRVYKLIRIMSLTEYVHWILSISPNNKAYSDYAAQLLNYANEYKEKHGTEPMVLIEFTVYQFSHDYFEKDPELACTKHETEAYDEFKTKLRATKTMELNEKLRILRNVDTCRQVSAGSMHRWEIGTSKRDLPPQEYERRKAIVEHIERQKKADPIKYYRRMKAENPFEVYDDEERASKLPIVNPPTFTIPPWPLDGSPLDPINPIDQDIIKISDPYDDGDPKLKQKADAEEAAIREVLEAIAAAKARIKSELKIADLSDVTEVPEVSVPSEVKNKEVPVPSEVKNKEVITEVKESIKDNNPQDSESNQFSPSNKSYIIVMTNVDLTYLLMGAIVLSWFSLAMVKVRGFKGVLFIILFRSCNFLRTVLRDQTGSKSEKFFPLLVLSFYIILIANLVGLIPGCFCLTSQLFITFALSFSFFIGLTVYGFLKQGYSFLGLFVPKNVPLFLVPFLVLIEVISYISRTFSLSIRLFANMVAGHALLHILLGATLVASRGLVIIFTLLALFFPISILLMSIVGLESGIAFLQAYVFVTLVTIYLNDSLNTSKH